MYEIDIDYYNK